MAVINKTMNDSGYKDWQLHAYTEGVICAQKVINATNRGELLTVHRPNE